MKIGVVGLGKLGLPLALVFAKAGFDVEGVETSRDRLAEIFNRNPVSEPKVNDYLDKYRNPPYTVKLSVNIAYGHLVVCPVVFVVVQTPSLANHVFDTQYVEAAVKAIHKVNKDCLIVISSTVPPKTCDKLAKIHRRIAYNPEFIKQGSIIDDFESPKFVMIGAYNEKDWREINYVWHEVAPYKSNLFLTPLEAEIAKLALNVSFCKDITFANVVGEFCESMNADSKAVMDVVNLDRRNYQAGLGYGGVCFPRDTRCFKALTGISGDIFMQALEAINEKIDFDSSSKIVKSEGNIAFIGLAYKRGVPITEESRSMNILVLVKHALRDSPYTMNLSREIYVYDECVEELYAKINKDYPTIKFRHTIESAIKKAATVFFGLPIKAPPKLLRGKRVIDPWGLNK